MKPALSVAKAKSATFRNGLICLGAAVAVVLLLSALAPAAGAAASVKTCGSVTAGGQQYSVSATNVSCSTAKTWAKVEAAKRVKPHAVNAAISGGPKGFKCRAGAESTGSSAFQLPAGVQVAGNCAKGLGLGSSPYFNWSVVYAAS
jgi:hypothetical protein